ncbi:transposase, partial [Mycoplasmopsis mucosicanis]|uniref:transposase n=1 Tax=Mycoplasmopsis mucosicanis TaxID=458208 RepID=UPI00147785EE
MDKNGLVAYEDVIGGKKYRFFEPIEKGGFYKLNIDKIEEDEQFDGFYVYETNRNDLKIEEIVNLYSKQWQVEENFRSFKGTLMLRPVYLSTWNHIVGYICLSFITLVFLNFILNMINKKTGLTGKSKITEHKLKEMIFDVKSVNTFIHNHISTSVEIKNNANSSSWETYHLIKTVLMKEKILLF